MHPDRSGLRVTVAPLVAGLPPPATAFGFQLPWALAAPADGQLLYRIVLREIPTAYDFLSMRDRRDPQRRGEDWLLYVGLSMFADRGQAEQVRDRFKAGQHVVEVPLLAGRGFMLARTRRTAGHYTVWGRPEELLAVVLDTRG